MSEAREALGAVRDEVGRIIVGQQGTVSGLITALLAGGHVLLHAAKAWAWLSGRDFVTPDEVKAVAKPTLRHRIQVRPEVELEGGTSDGVLDRVLTSVPVPR